MDKIAEIAEGDRLIIENGVAVIQPLLEPRIRGLKRFGSFAVFFYLRWSCMAVGYDIMKGGGAIHLGPLMFGCVRIRTFQDYADSVTCQILNGE